MKMLNSLNHTEKDGTTLEKESELAVVAKFCSDLDYYQYFYNLVLLLWYSLMCLSFLHSYSLATKILKVILSWISCLFQLTLNSSGSIHRPRELAQLICAYDLKFMDMMLVCFKNFSFEQV